MVSNNDSISVQNKFELVSREITGSSFWKIISSIDNNIFIVKRLREPGYFILKSAPCSSTLINNELEFYFKIDRIKPSYINILPLIDFNLDISVNNINHYNFIIPKLLYTLSDNLVYKHALNEFATKIIQTLEFIHSLGLVHLDLNPGNIVFDTAIEPFIIDFESVSEFDKDNQNQNNPNVFIHSNIYYQSLDIHFKIKSRRSDLISFGFILYQQLNNGRPLPWAEEIDNNKIMEMKMKFFENEDQFYFNNPILIRYFQIVFSRDIMEQPSYFALYDLFKF